MRPRRSRISNIQPRIGAVDTRAAKPPAKLAAPIYATPEYREWRATVIERADGVCEWSGCGRAETRMFADHIVELQDGGEPFALSNGQCLCGAHHSLKTASERARRHRMSFC
jgi:hypothetical protein